MLAKKKKKTKIFVNLNLKITQTKIGVERCKYLGYKEMVYLGQNEINDWDHIFIMWG